MRVRSVVVFSRSRAGGVMARRAEALARHAPPDVVVEVVHRPGGRREEAALLRRLAAAPPDVAYVFDSAPRELRAAALLRLRGTRVVVETGDVGWRVEAALGRRRSHVAWRRAVERASWRYADALAVRGDGFRGVLAELGEKRPVAVVPEGVDLDRFAPGDPAPGRARLGLAPDDVAVGVVGSITWSPVPRIAYGWELVEALPRLPQRVKAVVVGGGDGVARLRARAAELAVGDRLVTPGAVAHADVPAVLSALDAVTWTQTPDEIGRPRTTLKLPEYLAAGRFIVASDVGEARRSVGANGVRLPYAGGRDPAYVDAVAAAVRDVAADPEVARRRGLAGRGLAGRFAWPRVAEAFAGVVRSVPE